MMLTRMFAVAGLALVIGAGAAEARDQIRIVGSSTVFPFSTAVAERFGKSIPTIRHALRIAEQHAGQ